MSDCPGRRIEIIVASNTPTFAPSAVRNAIGQVLGLPSPDDGPPTVAGPRANAKAPAAAVATLIGDFVKAINGGNEAALTDVHRRQLPHRSREPAGGATRRHGSSGLHGNLGELKVVGLDQVSADMVEASVMTANDGAATLKIEIDAGAKPRIKSVQILVGG